jgi:hypothetical protein
VIGQARDVIDNNRTSERVVGTFQKSVIALSKQPGDIMLLGAEGRRSPRCV